MPKSSKRFIISDESLNRYGFRVLTSGIDLAQFKKNPLCLWMHQRAGKNAESNRLPIGHWTDIEIIGNAVTAIPFFSDKDAFAMEIYHKVEEGTIRMASAGIDPMEASTDAALMLAGQELPTVTKSVMYEASICDLGVNNNALTFYNGGVPINLADDKVGDYLVKLSVDGSAEGIQNILNKNSNKMKPEFLALAITLGLSNKATEEEFLQTVEANAKKLTTLALENTQLSTQLGTLKTENEALKAAAVEKDIDIMLSQAVAEGKITEGEKPDYLELALGNFDKVKAILDKKPVHLSAEAKMAAAAAGAGGENALLKMSYEELHTSGKLAEVKENHPDHYKSIFKAKFGKEPKL